MMRKHGLTKKDLAVALACITFLLANLAAIGAGGRRRAKEALCLSNLRQWGVIWQMYADINDGFFPDSPVWAHNDTLTALYKGMTYREVVRLVVAKYPGLSPDMRTMKILEIQFKENKVRFCPMATRTGEQGGIHPYQAWRESELLVRSDRETGSYGLNLWVVNDTGSSGTSELLWRTPFVKEADRVPVFLSCAYEENVAVRESDRPPTHEGYEGDPCSEWDNERGRICLTRHENGATNILFADFSVRKVALEHLWDLYWHRKWYVPPSNDWPPWMRRFPDYNGDSG